MVGEVSEAYASRCLKTLKEMGAPLEGWHCSDVEDMQADGNSEMFSSCALCGYDSVRFVHHMWHPDYPKTMDVGCICAGVMEGDVLASKERERIVRNRSKRRETFMKHKWKKRLGERTVHTRIYHGQKLKIITVYDPNSDLLSRLKETAKPLQYQVYVDKQRVYTYFGREITDFKVALLAAFEIADTPEKIMKSPGERKPRQKGKTI
ncbi:MAG: hypothetical protein J6A79_16745 [Clostridia bacterium]|nr:hypothetical protein [Clostridia bacterium]